MEGKKVYYIMRKQREEPKHWDLYQIFSKEEGNKGKAL